VNGGSIIDGVVVEHLVVMRT